MWACVCVCVRRARTDRLVMHVCVRVCVCVRVGSSHGVAQAHMTLEDRHVCNMYVCVHVCVRTCAYVCARGGVVVWKEYCLRTE